MASIRSRVPRRILLLGVAAALLLSLFPTGTASADTQKARSADSFVESIGVNTHLHYTNTVYVDFGKVRPLLEKLGVRYVRDGAYTHEAVSQNHFYYERLRALAASGIRFNLITSFQTSHGSRTNLSLLDDISRWTDGAVVSFEGANEPDLFGGGDWVEATVDLQKQLWATVQSAPNLHAVEVVGPSPAFAPGDLPDLSAYIDQGNWHGYPGGLCVGCQRGNGKTVLDYLPPHREWSGSAPVTVTETGYHTAVAVSDSETHHPVSEEAQAKYLPRLLLEYFNSGISRTYLYELIDLWDDGSLSDRDSHFGLIRNDGTTKPAYRALQNLIAILEDPGPRFMPGSLDFSLSGSTAGVHTTLLQQRDGTFYLALWREVASYDVDRRRDIDVEARQVTLRLGSPAALHVYRPNVSRKILESWSPRKDVTLAVGDEVLVLAIRDPNAPTPAPAEFSGSFVDDDNSVHEPAIELIAKAGITRGCNPPDNTKFCPRDVVTRGAMAAFLNRALGLPSTERDYFQDDKGSIFESDINRLAGSKITRGCNPPANNEYCPEDSVSRGQMAAFIARAWDLPSTDINYFRDDEGSLFEGAINSLAEARITMGCNPPENDRYCPNAPISREEMATLLVRVLGW